MNGSGQYCTVIHVKVRVKSDNIPHGYALLYAWVIIMCTARKYTQSCITMQLWLEYHAHVTPLTSLGYDTQCPLGLG